MTGWFRCFGISTRDPTRKRWSRGCEGVRLMVSGSAALPERLFDRWGGVTGPPPLERYGMTEAGMITSNPYDGERVAGTVGFPLPGVQARVVAEDGSELPHGEPGVLEIKGPNVFRGYWGMPEKTAEEFRPDGWFITGDIAVMADDGRVSIVGRAKDLIISGGFNVYPKEIESAIDDLPGVKESAVIGIPHPDFGEGVTAVVVAKPGAELDERAVIAALEGRLARYKLPRALVFVDQILRSPSGKADYRWATETASTALHRD